MGSVNRQVIGAAGRVVDETKSMFALDTKNGIKKFPKAYSQWMFTYSGGKAEIDGTKLTKRSYERIGVKA